jgi:hypothetical protein
LKVGRTLWYLHPGAIFLEREEGDSMSIRPSQSLKDSVVFIYTEQNGKRYPVGTAFQIYIDEGDLVCAYIVTCKHVVKPLIDGKLPIDIRFNRQGKTDVYYARLTSNNWHFHSDNAVDIAVLPVWNSFSKPTVPLALGAWDFNGIQLTPKVLVERGEQLAEGDDILFIALFDKYTGYHRNIPVVRFGKIALLTDELLEGEYGPTTQYLVEAQAYPGNSGAPIYRISGALPRQTSEGKLTFLSPMLYLLGVVVSFYPDIQKIYQYPRGSTGKIEMKIYTHFGISAVVPSERIHEILHAEAAINERAQYAKKEHAKNKPEPAYLKEHDTLEFTKNDFKNALKKVSRRVKPSEPYPK